MAFSHLVSRKVEKKPKRVPKQEAAPQLTLEGGQDPGGTKAPLEAKDSSTDESDSSDSDEER